MCGPATVVTSAVPAVRQRLTAFAGALSAQLVQTGSQSSTLPTNSRWPLLSPNSAASLALSEIASPAGLFGAASAATEEPYHPANVSSAPIRAASASFATLSSSSRSLQDYTFDEYDDDDDDYGHDTDLDWTPAPKKKKKKTAVASAPTSARSSSKSERRQIKLDTFQAGVLKEERALAEQREGFKERMLQQQAKIWADIEDRKQKYEDERRKVERAYKREQERRKYEDRRERERMEREEKREADRIRLEEE